MVYQAGETATEPFGVARLDVDLEDRPVQGEPDGLD